MQRALLCLVLACCRRLEATDSAVLNGPCRVLPAAPPKAVGENKTVYQSVMETLAPAGAIGGFFVTAATAEGKNARILIGVAAISAAGALYDYWDKHHETPPAACPATDGGKSFTLIVPSTAVPQLRMQPSFALQPATSLGLSAKTKSLLDEWAAAPPPRIITARRSPEGWLCSNANRATEFAVCADDQLIGLDNELNHAYQARLNGPNGDLWKADQRIWLQRYLNTCDRVTDGQRKDCIAQHLQARTLELLWAQ